jgi:hypothetical protein
MRHCVLDASLLTDRDAVQQDRGHQRSPEGVVGDAGDHRGQCAPHAGASPNRVTMRVTPGNFFL